MAFELKIKLVGSQKPPIWRKVKVNNNITFHDLHKVIQSVFYWEDYHLYLFSPKGWGSYPKMQKDPEEDDFRDCPVTPASQFPNGQLFDTEEVKLNQYFTEEKQKIVYIYDFGDGWEHEVVLEKITEEIVLNPICISGKGNAPLEDSGGMWGYYNMVEAINNPKHKEHKYYREYLGVADDEHWDIMYFDKKLAEEKLRNLE